MKNRPNNNAAEWPDEITVTQTYDYSGALNADEISPASLTGTVTFTYTC